MNAKPAPPKQWACPTPDKQTFGSELDAKLDLIKELGSQLVGGGNGLKAFRVYPCVCNRWHWTSKEPKRQ